MIRIAAIVVTALLAPAALTAQEFKPSANPVTDAVRDRLNRDLKHFVAAADLMPADKYDYHPTPAQMTFGKLVAHVVQTNVYLCASIAGAPPSADLMTLLQTLTGAEPKNQLVAAVRQSSDYCTDVFSRADDTHLADQAVVMGRGLGQSRGALMVTLAADWADHYSTAASYLRLNGMLPPSATK